MLGIARLVAPDGRALRLERRAAALFAYLALCGPSPKYPLACLLWPDSEPTMVRNNMRALLRRLRMLTDAELVLGDAEGLQLAPDARVDAALLREAAEGGRHADVLAASRAQVLEGLELEGCSELERWLEAMRVAVEGWRRTARERELARLEGAGDLGGALALVRGWVQVEPESEEAARAQMRLHFLRGERGAALAAFQRVSAVLEQELGVRPTPETLALAREIEHAAPAHPPTATPPRPLLPLAVRRPRILVGRDEAWEQVERACMAGKMVFLVGEAGIGKTRLSEEIAESWGMWHRTEGRLGDTAIPYASQARALRAILSQRPTLQLPEWIRRELLRLMPELGGPGEQPRPLSSAEDKLRFYDAVTEVMWSELGRFRTIVTDDVQYWDAASSELFTYALLSREARQGAAWRHERPHLIDCYREAELPTWSRQAVARLVAAERAEVVRLAPLSAPEVHALLEGLGVRGLAEHAQALAQHTGGNPLFVVETVRHLLETGALERGWPERLPIPAKVSTLIQHRLERLSSRALVLAQVAAVAGAQFSLRLAARILRQPERELREAARELEGAQLLVDERFSHDLIHETLEAAMAPAMKAMLHGLVAAVLEEQGAPPILLAQHWLRAAEPSRALPQLLKAANGDEEVLLSPEAAELYATAATLLAQAGLIEDAALAREHERSLRLRN
ncbi:AAA family ATPase [Aggregicoccus sp. 17bor-14]|nr:AAA family ATPase [Simulacricoccus sp. 17bor-14]MRI88987.1 AAA family ATPase [Aggregicoccus sp. 17bor-14]